MQTNEVQKTTQFPHGTYLLLTTGSNRGEIRFQIPMESGIITSPSGSTTKRVTLVTGVFKKGAIDAQRLTGFGDLISPVVDEVLNTNGWRPINWDEINESAKDLIARRAINLVNVRMPKEERAELYRQRAMASV